MIEDINAYDMHHNPEKAWNTFANEANNLRCNLYIMSYNKSIVGEMPNDIKQILRALATEIRQTLAQAEKD